ncbi:DHA2 family efflux MFS transporter permease subunit [Halobacillus litoralis]|uniref:DHA2 family efflux MFS transporter permease subunit n=1 Tax=Halobacillus litoralis TaxID=45668 RepID=A0A845FBI2_9BACI|nr:MULTISPECIES: DHA2 family efflux MFS transporter permease subunit [Halobacillus]MEC3884751.1 DHA2 family efflux MFS transporter permease subunit [Halobacillus sp. HZG1]MYL71290.1 DHA2 family efflux MFS transporter permease subunit [Halobacillus litoralis]
MTSKGTNKVLMAALLLAGSFITILNQTLMITAIPPIMDEMNVTANSAQWLTTVFMLVNGVMIPVSAFLIERFTTRQLFISAMSVFAFGTILGGLALNFPLLLLGRVVQSAGAGVMLPLMQTVFLMIFPVHKRGAAMGYIGLVISFAPAIGPALSGYITSAYTWRYLFWMILPLAILIIVLAYFILKNVTELSYPKVDPVSIILSSVGFGGLLYGFTLAGNQGWTSIDTVTVLTIGAVTLTLFILRQLRMHHPMLEFRVFKYPVFAITTVIAMITFLGLIGAETLIPLFMQDMREFSAFESGLALLPGAVITALMSPITGRIFDKIGARLLAVVGLTIITGATLAFSFLNIETTFTTITVLYAIRMFGLSMVMMPVTTAGLNQLPKKLIPHGAAMSNTMRMVAASVGTAILVTVMTTTAQTAESNPSIDHPSIYGVNIAFFIVTALSLAGLVLAFFVKRTYPPDEEQVDETGENQYQNAESQ